MHVGYPFKHLISTIGKFCFTLSLSIFTVLCISLRGLFHSSDANFFPSKLMLTCALQLSVLSATGGIQVEEPRMINGTCAMLKLVLFFSAFTSFTMSSYI